MFSVWRRAPLAEIEAADFILRLYTSLAKDANANFAIKSNLIYQISNKEKAEILMLRLLILVSYTRPRLAEKIQTI